MEDNLLEGEKMPSTEVFCGPKGVRMFTLKVSGMTCSGCINAVTRAIQAQDPQAKVQVDLATQVVSLETNLSAERATELITDSGFPVSQ